VALCGKLTDDDITNILKLEYDCCPGAIADALALREPKYQETAAYCHFGRQPHTKDGINFFEWENPKGHEQVCWDGQQKGVREEVTAALTASNYLTTWVD